MSTAVPLLPVFMAYQGRAPFAEAEEVDAIMGYEERLLSQGEIVSPDDLFAKARYIQDTGRIDPSLIPMEAIDTLVAGILRLMGPTLSQSAPLGTAA
ncbi:hypothetical protein D3877_10100 [Azospirillum cavernae]|uniref:Uncharacterized protein n=1 Tax=Azospirillum cavernae TaxID=2320860 RepID=A0A418W470_9PROT|nr:hypothetical protein [Azospirillum cavernae]RJF84821.1 hypothetical protein D3877_10100 [Azospirillum cavernae]